MAVVDAGHGSISDVADGGYAHVFDTNVAYTSGFLASFRENGDEVASIDFEGSYSGHDGVFGGLVTVAETLAVTGATTLSSTLDVTGATTLSSTLDSTGAATLDTGANGSSFGGDLTISGVFEVDTAGTGTAGNNEIWMTAGNGLNLAGSGTSQDVIIRNKNGDSALSVDTGTRGITVVGACTLATGGSASSFGGDLAVSGVFEIDTNGSGTAGKIEIWKTAAQGLNLSGSGSSFDVIIRNKSGNSALAVPTGTRGIEVVGDSKFSADLEISANLIGGQLGTTPTLSNDTWAQYQTDGTAGIIGDAGDVIIQSDSGGTEKDAILYDFSADSVSFAGAKTDIDVWAVDPAAFLGVRARRWNYRDIYRPRGNRAARGFVAEELAEVSPRLVHWKKVSSLPRYMQDDALEAGYGPDEEVPWRVNQQAVLGAHHTVLQDHEARIQALEEENSRLRAMLN